METPEHYRQTIRHLELKAATQRRNLTDPETRLAEAKRLYHAARAAQSQRPRHENH